MCPWFGLVSRFIVLGYVWFGIPFRHIVLEFGLVNVAQCEIDNVIFCTNCVNTKNLCGSYRIFILFRLEFGRPYYHHSHYILIVIIMFKYLRLFLVLGYLLLRNIVLWKYVRKYLFSSSSICYLILLCRLRADPY